MDIEFNEAVLNLKLLITDDNFKMPDRTGVTPLLRKAKDIAVLSPLSAEKKFEELVVCKLVDYFPEFHQVNFSELESYISVSDFPSGKIIEAFERFVRKNEENEDIILKACVARTIQSFNERAMPLDYIENRFISLKKLDPWLMAELTINSNFSKGIELIAGLLQTDYDASYLFSIVPKIIAGKTNTELAEAFSSWNNHLNKDDKELAAYYAKNYGFEIIVEDLPAHKAKAKITVPQTYGIKQSFDNGHVIETTRRSRTDILKRAGKSRIKAQEMDNITSVFVTMRNSSVNGPNYRTPNLEQKRRAENNYRNRTMEKS